MKLKELAHLTGAEMEDADADVEITGAAGLDDADETQISFLSNPRYTANIKTTKARAVYVTKETEVREDIIALRVSDPYLAYTRALRLFHPEPKFTPSIHPTAVIHPTAQIAEGVLIESNVVVGQEAVVGKSVRIYPNVTIYNGVVIGEDSVIHSGVALRENTQIGKRVIIHNNTVIGSDGFGYAKDEEKHWLKIPQTGRVVIEDDVEIGACTTIDKASVGETRIARGVKIDNQVQVGHSCTVGEDTLLCGQVGLAGTSHIGSRVILAGQVGVGGHLTVGDDAILMARSGIFFDVPAGKVLSGGVPAFDHKESLRAMAAFRKLGDMQRTLRTLETRLAEIENKTVEECESKGDD